MTEENITWTNTKVFIPPLTHGYVIKVYDGDTITIATKLPLIDDENYYRFSVRLRGIDTPEMKTSNEDEKEIALLAKEYVKNLVYNKTVQLQDIEYDKYGRLLSNVYYNETNISTFLLEKRLALAYDGGTKVIPDSWKLYYETGELYYPKETCDQ